MRENFRGNKRRKEELRKKKQEEKRNKRLLKKEQTSLPGVSEAGVSPEMPVLPVSQEQQKDSHDA